MLFALVHLVLRRLFGFVGGSDSQSRPPPAAPLDAAAESRLGTSDLSTGGRAFLGTSGRRGGKRRPGLPPCVQRAPTGSRSRIEPSAVSAPG